MSQFLEKLYLRLHNAKLKKVRSCIPKRFLFRIEFNHCSGPRNFIGDPPFAPLAIPAFRASNPSAELTSKAQVLHCGGTASDRDSSPYISCTRDLFWCIVFAVDALLTQNAYSTIVYIILDSSEYDINQTKVCSRDGRADWPDSKSNTLVDQARACAIFGK
jgi:hypothetical protein